MASIIWERDIAEVYDRVAAADSAPEVLDPMVELLAELAGPGPVVEFAVGTGRVALPLAARGLGVHGIELSGPMAEQLRATSSAVPVTVGDMTTTRLPGEFGLVYLVANTITNVTTLDEQLAVFANAAAHLGRGGLFVVEVGVPHVRRGPVVFRMEPDHVGVDTYDDPVKQVMWSHHWMDVDGRAVRHAAPYRYVWPAELDLMGRLNGFRLRDRWGGWRREPLTSDSTSQVAVFEKI